MSEPKAIRLVMAAIAASVGARLVSLQALHPLNWDEIEFFRATDWVRQGLVPYRDFFEHHTPLQWFVFGPITALTHSAGVDAVLTMRWAQVPLWIAIFVLIQVWMIDERLSPFARWAAMAFPLTSTLFMLPAVEYRVDVLAGGLLIAALVCIQRMERSVWYALAAGAALCLSGFANLRMGPVLVLTMLMARIIDFPKRRWGGNARANWIFAGAAGMFALCSIYFLATRSAATAFRHLIVDNFLADKWAVPPIAHMMLHRLVAPFGFHLAPGQAPFTPSTVDPGGIVVVVAGTAAMIHLLVSRRRTPDALFFLAFVQITNLLFIGAMKFVFNYHLVIAAALMVPLLASEIERFPNAKAVLALIAVTAVVNVAVALFRGKEADLGYQDTIMQALDSRTPPGSAVWDSVGWALHRRPAYRYWFLREIVVVLERHGIFPTYTPADMIRNPPAAVVPDWDTRVWMARHLPLARFVTSQYLPTWMNLWLPGLSASLRAGEEARWIVPAAGTYTIYASERLARHPWFLNPLDLEAAWWRNRALTQLRDDDVAAAPVEFTVNDVPVGVSATSMNLAEHDVVTAINRDSARVGVMLARVPREELFMAPPAGVTIEASSSPQWHVPNF
ncbi:MAG TPA: hypothetical protein VKH35_09350 [Thermoanaerobaculia bacterium]|nr:hypothetical protein [Thermoanaerobaculia bacterium]